MKSPMLLWRELTQELGEWCRVSTSRDLVTATARVEDEGLSFLTITLPNMAKDFEQALAYGKIEHDHFAGFSRSGSLPRFLGGFFAQVFDRRTGALLDTGATDAVYAIRQICRFASKIELPCSQRRQDAALEAFVRVEQELEEAERRLDPDSLSGFLRVSRLLLGRVLSDLDLQIATGELVPRHGSGNTADRLLGNQKYNQRVWHWRLETGGFPSVDFLLPNSRFYQSLDHVRFLDPGDEPPVKVKLVPKTLKTPRVIAVEPTAMQYCQQAVARSLVRALESDYVARHFIGFTDQEPNQLLACVGSVNSDLATLDLSEASDRVLNSLTKVLFRGYTNLSEAVQSSRTMTADVPGHGVIPLTKFASMGSALTFPVEAMVFTTLCFLGIERAQGTKLTEEQILKFQGRVRIYGDDIIVPAEYALSVMQTLEEFAFRVNANKSFWTGKFRESCGRDFYAGTEVTTLKCRRMLPVSRRDVNEVISAVSLRNQLFKRGFVTTVQYLDDLLESLLGDYPEVSEGSSLLGRLGYEDPVLGSKRSKHSQTPLKKGWVVDAVSPRNGLDGEGALLKFFLNAGDEPSADEKHLERSGRPRAVNIKRAWAPV